MIILFSDYGNEGPYLGQVEAAILRHAMDVRIVNLTANAPRNDPRAAAYLLAAYATDFPVGSIMFCVVDPGVGSQLDSPVLLEIDGKNFVGPNNGLFDILARRARNVKASEITWKPGSLSMTFHGRDLYAPVCGMLAAGKRPELEKFTWKECCDFPDELYEVIYIDHFGNCMTGLRAKEIGADSILRCKDKDICSASTFADVAPGELFWYENANGLLEIAVNQGDAASKLNLSIGSSFCIS